MHQRSVLKAPLALMILMVSTASSQADVIYWNVINHELNTNSVAEFTTYSTVTDMLNDQNRTSTVLSGNFDIVDSGSDGSTYWNVINRELNTNSVAEFATYSSITDMFKDQNRTSTILSGNFDIVGSGSDGSTYWNVINRELNTNSVAEFATYSSITDMFKDQNRTSTILSGNFDIVGSGSDGSTYWNVINRELNTNSVAEFATYSSITDMFNDQNRTSTVLSANLSIVGSGAVTSVPEPSAFALMSFGLAASYIVRRVRRD